MSILEKIKRNFIGSWFYKILLVLCGGFIGHFLPIDLSLSNINYEALYLFVGLICVVSYVFCLGLLIDEVDDEIIKIVPGFLFVGLLVWLFWPIWVLGLICFFTFKLAKKIRGE